MVSKEPRMGKVSNSRQGIHFEGISIRNFKSLHLLEAEGFSPKVNLITGKNNSGKTSLLEALFLCLGPTNPQLALNINGRRGLDRASVKESTIPYLFYELDTQELISITPRLTGQQQFTIEAEYLVVVPEHISGRRKTNGNGKPQSIELSVEGIGEEVGLRLSYFPAEGEPRTTYLIISSDGGANIRGERAPIFKNSVYLSAHLGHDVQTTNAERYSTLDKQGRIPEFEQYLREIEPQLKRTSLAIENGRALVHADIGYGLVPLATLGSGMTKLTSILVSITEAQDAVVLIDEIENSFHHTSLPRVWAAIEEFAKYNNCQVFAATHSDECIAAAYDVFKDRADNEFYLHRIVKKKGKSELFTFDNEQIEAALSSGWELR